MQSQPLSDLTAADYKLESTQCIDSAILAGGSQPGQLEYVPAAEAEEPYIQLPDLEMSYTKQELEDMTKLPNIICSKENWRILASNMCPAEPTDLDEPLYKGICSPRDTLHAMGMRPAYIEMHMSKFRELVDKFGPALHPETFLRRQGIESLKKANRRELTLELILLAQIK